MSFASEVRQLDWWLQENSFSIFSDKIQHDCNAIMIFLRKTQSIEASNYYASLEWKKRRREQCREAVKAVVDGCLTTSEHCVGVQCLERKSSSRARGLPKPTLKQALGVIF